MRILIAEDERVTRVSLARQLESWGHSVTSAEDGQSAWDAFGAAEFDLVITDRAMPVMNGLQMVSAIRRLEPDVPIILLTGFGDIMEAAGEHPEGVTLVLAKPVTLAVFRQALVEATCQSRL